MITIELTIVYIAILIFVSLLLLLIGIVVTYIRLTRKYLDLKEGRIKDVDPMTLLANAQGEAQKMLVDANSQAQQILAKAKEFMSTGESTLTSEMKNVSQIYANKYGLTLKEIETESLKMLQNIPEDVRKILGSEITNIKIALTEEAKKAENDAKAIVVDAYKKAEAEVESYKSERFRQIDESVLFILKELARKVLAKEISQEEHEKLVLKALDEAKRQNVFVAGTNSQDESLTNQQNLQS